MLILCLLLLSADAVCCLKESCSLPSASYQQAGHGGLAGLDQVNAGQGCMLCMLSDVLCGPSSTSSDTFIWHLSMMQIFTQ